MLPGWFQYRAGRPIKKDRNTDARFTKQAAHFDSRTQFMKRFSTLAMLIAVATLSSACSMPARPRTDPATPIEQLLISEAIQRGIEDMQISIASPEQQEVYLDTTGLTSDQEFMGNVMRGWLGRLGFEIENDIKNADFQLNLVIQSVGTHRRIRFFGMPAARSAWFPIAVPELALYKRNRQEGYVRFYFDVFNAETGAYISRTRDFEGDVHVTKFTIFLVFDWQTTNLRDKEQLEELKDLELIDPE
jgi:hypothetical protein